MIKREPKPPVIIPATEALKIEEPTPQDLERESRWKKIDANDLAHRLGVDGFTPWLKANQHRRVFTHFNPSPIMSLGRIFQNHPVLRPTVIDQILRRGEVMNIIAAPKRNKSMLVLNLLMAVISGGDWLGTFKCTRGRVLVVDNELHKESISFRGKEVCKAFNISPERAGKLIDYAPLRGDLVDINGLKNIFRHVHPGSLSLCVLDAFYKFMPSNPRVDENSNADMANLYNLVDKYAKDLDCAIVLIHHTSKGLQSGRDVTDVGAGAGAQSRAADTHLVLREHKQDDAVVVDAAVRSFPPLKAFCARFAFPKWVIDTSLNAEDLKGTELQKEREERKAERKKKDDDANAAKETLISKITTPMSPTQIHEISLSLGLTWSRNPCKEWIVAMTGKKKLTRTREQKGQTPALYVVSGAESNNIENLTNSTEGDKNGHQNIENVSNDAKDDPSSVALDDTLPI